MKKTTLRLAFAIAALLPLMAAAADAHRQAEVAKRGQDVMPFSLPATVHNFTKTADGGTQRVVARNIADAGQARLVRQHLQELPTQFLRGDFSGPAHIHGHDMPGLTQLRAAKPGQIAIDYREVEGGAELVFRSADARLVSALHQWFDAQVSEHGPDAMAGHRHQDKK
ncbi:MAG: aspartate carbamoyltransferase [Burkholderiaceae bacterium]